MPSFARKHQLQASLIYHVMNRGNARQDLFHEPLDYQYFKQVLSKYAATNNLNLYHWALMTNHYHLCLEAPHPEALSKIMAGLQRSYVHYHHRKYHSAGFLFQGRFRSQPIQKERYLLACGRYIEQNPVKAGLTSRAEEYEQSSARFYTAGVADGVTVMSPLYETFGRTPAERRTAYRDFLEQSTEEHRLFESATASLGDDEFLGRLVRKRGRLVGRRRGGRLSSGVINAQHIVSQLIT